MIPTLRQLRYLTLLAEHGAFGRAAEAAHVSQPALSAGIAELERVLGSAVVERGRGGVRLTAVGQAAASRAADVLARAEDLVQAARAAGRPLSGRFRLGVIPTVAPFLLPRALPILRDRFPELRLFLREDMTHRLIAALKAGTLDAALIALPYDTAGLEHAHVSDDELLAITPSDHPLASRPRLTAEDMGRGPLILLEGGHCLRDHALAACDLEAPVAAADEESFAATSLPTLVQMVGSGLGLSLAPAMAVAAGLTDAAPIAVRPLSTGEHSREIVVAWRAGSSRAAEGRLLAEALRGA